jgi:hypothetical protein
MFTQSLVATVVSWLGIVGGALAILGNLQTAFSLSDWTRGLGSHWQGWMLLIWGDYLGLSHVFPNASFFLVDVPFVFCLSLIAVASRFAPGSGQDDVSVHRRLYSLIAGAALLAMLYVLVAYVLDHGYTLSLTFVFAIEWLVVFLMLSHWPYKLALLSASATMVLLTLMLIAGNDTTPPTHMDLVIEVALMIAAGAVVVFVARPAVFTRQICFLLFLVAVLVAVSELSKLGISLEPPKA